MLSNADIKLLLSLVITFSSCFGLNLPSYIKPCSLSDPNLKSCVLQNAQNAIPQLRKGDQTYKIPKMDPLIIPKIELNMGEDLKINFTKILVSHVFENIKFKELDFNPKNGFIKIHLLDEGFSGDFNYEMNMKLMGLPIVGTGLTHVNISEMDTNYEATVKTIKKGNKEYFSIDKSNTKILFGKASFYFDNLFNGDKRLGDATNKLINDNWKDFIEVLQPAVIDIFEGLINICLKGIFDVVPTDILFLP